jgi:hypothetical protein
VGRAESDVDGSCFSCLHHLAEAHCNNDSTTVDTTWCGWMLRVLDPIVLLICLHNEDIELCI